MSLSPAWRSLLIASLTMTVHAGVLLTFPVVYVALLEEFRWGRGEGAGIFALTTLVIGLAGPLVGTLLDSLGPRRLFVGGALLTAAGMAATSLGSALPYFYATYGAMTGLGHSALGSVPNMVVVSQWFPQATGRAIALADVGTALGMILIVPAAQWVILQVGWRVTLWALAAFIVLMLVPANLLQGVPERSVRGPDGNGCGDASADVPGDSRTMRAALTRGAFYWLVLARLTSGLAFQMMMVHMIPYAIGAGYGKMTAASLLGAVSAVSMAGRLLVGVAADRLGRGFAATLAYASASAGILALMQIQTGGMGALAIFVLLYGLSQGSSGIVVAARAADLFQGRHFGRIYGWISITSGAGEALGAWLGGAVYDLTGSYRMAFAAALVALAGGAATLWMTYVGESGRRRKRA